MGVADLAGRAAAVEQPLDQRQPRRSLAVLEAVGAQVGEVLGHAVHVYECSVSSRADLEPLLARVAEQLEARARPPRSTTASGGSCG